MRDYIGLSLMAFGLIAFFAGLATRHRGEISKRDPDKGVEVVCKTCRGTGETEQDVNLLMARGAYAIWLNSHSANCEECKVGSCEAAKEKQDEIMAEYRERGPRMEKAACPDCMGMGGYTQFKGFRFGRERD